eukprot:CAMPEP_0115081562 /NCGR_PEP_ID=MMETSP0227-20121206/19352_1 /TAXON_ID=89957 /ORGANISM="Polarella glacialis, Strain CCMP 1383" /LENGTH=134 /DNA_ID=CAMNT_0002469429 /DNA_START=214 /DNA_END=617 /DNA_ORIENTATION=-
MTSSHVGYLPFLHLVTTCLGLSVLELAALDLAALTLPRALAWTTTLGLLPLLSAAAAVTWDHSPQLCLHLLLSLLLLLLLGTSALRPTLGARSIAALGTADHHFLSLGTADASARPILVFRGRYLPNVFQADLI